MQIPSEQLSAWARPEARSQTIADEPDGIGRDAGRLAAPLASREEDILLRRISPWPDVTYDWGNGETCTKGEEAGFELLSFDVTASANGHSGSGFGCVIARNEADNVTFRTFNQFLASILPPDPKEEDFPDIVSFFKAHRSHCSDLAGWPSIPSWAEFLRLQQSVLTSETFRTDFVEAGCFLGKESVVFGHDYVLYKNALWAQEADLNMGDCIDVIEGLLERERRKVDYLRGSGNGVASPRVRIPESVRSEVWRRDEGRCVRCGSRRRLEFDHIVPLSRGGSNTVRNIELLCETCNGLKGDSI